MALEIQEIREVLKKPRNRNRIPTANNHELKLRFHTETGLTRGQLSAAATTFLEWVKSLIPGDKFAIFLSLFRFPIDTVKLTDETFQALEKVFDGRDPVFQYDFLTNDASEDWERYRTEVLKEPQIWKTKGFEAMKTSINSVLICDLPSEQTTENPEPYFYWLDINDVIDYKNIDNDIDWIIFRLGGGKIAVYDDENYRVFQTKDGSIFEITETLVDEKHDLTYCPARFFWTDPISYKTPDLKKSPISNYLAALDWILFYQVSKRYSDLYAPWTIYWGYVQDCDFEVEESGHYCDNGFLKNREDKYLLTSGGLVSPCPVCKNKIAGVGSFIDVMPPSDENGKVALSPPAGTIPVDIQSLEYNVSEIERLERNFYKSVTGNSLESVNKDQAINEKQVMSLFESRKQALLKLKVNFEEAQKWVDSTICRLRYGYEFISSNINYGTEFYLFAPETILQMYKEARDAKLDSTTLVLLQWQYYETLHRNDPMKLQRMKILINLDPFRHLTVDQVAAMYQRNEVLFEDYFLKANFSTLLTKFERENSSVLEFGININFSNRIEAILNALKSYIKKPESKPDPLPTD